MSQPVAESGTKKKLCLTNAEAASKLKEKERLWEDAAWNGGRLR
jgi:hypothetical protein